MNNVLFILAPAIITELLLATIFLKFEPLDGIFPDAPPARL